MAGIEGMLIWNLLYGDGGVLVYILIIGDHVYVSTE
jgi:hypothetical protein